MMMRQLLLDEAKAIMGWMSEGELSLLAEFASDLKENSVIFEIGSLYGKSARVMADNSLESCRIYCIDPWKFSIMSSIGLIEVDETTFGLFYVNLYKHIKSGKVRPQTLKWEDFTPTGKADFIFIDGDHSYKSVRHDIMKSIRYIKHNGIIAGHDYNMEDVQRAVHEFFTDVHVKESIWWTEKF